jgi:hypothetical protein
MNPAKHYNACVGCRGPLAQAQRIANVVAQVLDLWTLVKVHQDNRVVFTLEIQYVPCQLSLPII